MSANETKTAHVPDMAAYDALVAQAQDDYDGYWSRLAREFLSWKTPFTKGLDDSQAPFFKWFEDGTLNVSYNCLDRQVERGLGDKAAIIFLCVGRGPGPPQRQDGKPLRWWFLVSAAQARDEGAIAHGAHGAWLDFLDDVDQVDGVKELRPRGRPIGQQCRICGLLAS